MSTTSEPRRRIAARHLGVLAAKPSDWPVEGLLLHVAGETASGFRVIDVWQSEEAFRQFGEALAPIMARLGLEEEPEVYPVHTFVSA